MILSKLNSKSIKEMHILTESTKKNGNAEDVLVPSLFGKMIMSKTHDPNIKAAGICEIIN